jgi:hypothetical protein
MGKVGNKEAVAYFDSPELVAEPGFYVLEGEAEVDHNGVKHETNMKPGYQVWSNPDGDGFVTEQPEGGDE